MMSDLAATIFPWPPKAEREAAVARARASRIRAEADLAHTRAVGAELHDIVYRGNHFADGIAAELRRGYGGGK